jgi:hypothetical protein
MSCLVGAMGHSTYSKAELTLQLFSREYRNFQF